MQQMTSQFQFGMMIKSVGEGRKIRGYASTGNIDRSGDSIPPSLLVEAFSKYLEYGTMLYEHGQDPTYARKTIGLITNGYIDEKGLQVEATISDDWIWEKIQLGELKAFSVGGRAQWQYDAQKDVNMATMIDLYEISVVAIPDNTEAMFEIAKSFTPDIDSKQYNKNKVSDNNQNLMEEMIKSLQERVENLLSSDEEKKELKKSLETVNEEKVALEAKVEELTKSLEEETAKRSDVEAKISELDEKLTKMLPTQKKAKVDPEENEKVEQLSPEEVVKASEELEKSAKKLILG